MAGARAYVCVYCHDLDRSHAINDVTKKKRLNASMIKQKKNVMAEHDRIQNDEIKKKKK